jgi:TPP-dependent pyruvate/acetoin dehydrogenase alpha subunit
MPNKAHGGSLISDAKLKELYASMLRNRLVAEHARRLRKRGAAAFYQASMGQEALITGCAIDLRPGDEVVDTVAPGPSPAALLNGTRVKEVVAQLQARSSQNPARQQLLTSATTSAEANKAKNDSVVVVFASAMEGGLKNLRGALTSAARQSLPMIFVVENNPWSEKLREHKNLKAQRQGLTSIAVDGNDVVAVYRVAHEALERVRQAGGPVLIEGKTFRHDGRSPVAVERDPLVRMEQYLAAKGLFSLRWKNSLVRKLTRELATAVVAKA